MSWTWTGSFTRRAFRSPGFKNPEVQKSYYYVDTGIIASNVYLFAASQGLAAWFHNCDRSALALELKLRADERVLFAQSVGYPAEAESPAPSPARRTARQRRVKRG